MQKPVKTQEQYDRELKLMTELLSDGQWYTSKEIKEKVGLSDRDCRYLAEHSLVFVSLPSNKYGYKLLAAASQEEINLAYEIMSSRLIRIRKRVAHLGLYVDKVG